MELFQKYIILTLQLDPQYVELETDFIRDISNVGHHGTGDVEVKIRNDEDFEKSKELLDRHITKIRRRLYSRIRIYR